MGVGVCVCVFLFFLKNFFVSLFVPPPLSLTLIFDCFTLLNVGVSRRAAPRGLLEGPPTDSLFPFFILFYQTTLP